MKYKLVELVILFLLCWMGYYQQTCRSTGDWADNFNDGTYEPEWTIVVNPALWGIIEGFGGSYWSATNGFLQMIQSYEDWGVIEHSSDVAYGKWSFDILLNLNQVEPGTFAVVNFIGNDLLDLNDVNEMESYLIQFRTGASLPYSHIVLRLWKLIRGNDFPIDVSEAVPVAGWHHIDVTRTRSGLFSVYLNDSLIMQGVDIDISTSEMFWLRFHEGQMIDNVKITPLPSQPPLWGLSFTVVVAVVVIWVVFFFIRRR